MIQPHGGKLVDKVIRQKEKERLREKAKRVFQLVLGEEKAKEVQNIAH
jgi:ATP sulfurylase